MSTVPIVTQLEEQSDSEDELLKVLEGVVGRVITISELKKPPTPKPSDLQDFGDREKAVELASSESIDYYQSLSRFARKRWRKQAREQSACSLNSGGN
ncbi:hypothetical protein RHSIM_Rhsim07G0154300 [Rhododendron simsii]|uniref:Uncharacterized protein n=1 Tax=Rhododendron simsii TaxID=118357 RepID=A0A834GL64_RHOSS|nr:hypothetical protein RHSIM_Rhsim07G0154300 [Rhododendron simsii]